MAERLTGRRKAAILVTLIGEDAATRLLQHLDEQEVEGVLAEVARLDVVDPSENARVLAEFQQMIQQTRGLETAGREKVRRLVQKARPDAADELLARIGADDADEEPDPADGVPRPRLPDALVHAPARTIARLLAEENDQTTALVLAFLPSQKAARILGEMPAERRAEIVARMAAMSQAAPEAVQHVGEILVTRLEQADDAMAVPVDGLGSAADRLGTLGRAAGQEIVAALEERDAELAQKLRERLFTFEIVLSVQDRDMPDVLKKVERGTLALALKGADPELQDKFFRGMSERAAQMLREEMDFLGAPRVADVENAQRVIVEAVLEMEKNGEITLEEANVVAQ
ncbi:MAG: flagellar motor switch protein FliG [Acidobacteria bacterium]|nr:MAG: flagellar motor switch protein FliG [Acidobacteriota bacterium]